MNTFQLIETILKECDYYQEYMYLFSLLFDTPKRVTRLRINDWFLKVNPNKNKLYVRNKNVFPKYTEFDLPDNKDLPLLKKRVNPILITYGGDWAAQYDGRLVLHIKTIYDTCIKGFFPWNINDESLRNVSLKTRPYPYMYIKIHNNVYDYLFKDFNRIRVKYNKKEPLLTKAEELKD